MPREKHLAPKPANLSFEEAAASPWRESRPCRDFATKDIFSQVRKVLINGASGGVGTFACRLPKSFGAEVTGVCSTRNLDKARSIGADQVIDYTKKTSPRTGSTTTFDSCRNGYHSISATSAP